MPDHATKSCNATKQTFANHLRSVQLAAQHHDLAILLAAQPCSTAAQSGKPMAHRTIFSIFHLPAENLGTLALAFVMEQSEDQALHPRAEDTMLLLLVNTIMILPVESEIPPHNTPFLAIPANQSTLPVEVSTHSLVPATPHPTGTTVIIIPPVQVPIRTNATPSSTVTDVKSAKTIPVVADATESTPTPLETPNFLPEMVAAPQGPISTDCDPLPASPTSENSQLVQMPANASRLTTPEPPPSAGN